MTMTQEEIDALISGGLDVTEETKLESNTNDNNDEQEPQLKFDSLDPKLELLLDLQLPVSIELGRTNMLIRDILRLGRGSVIEFDKLVSEPIDVLINGKKVAEGEVVVIDKHFGIRITTLIDPSERLKAARS
jgi:flagellar motor switch protein FliN/FliY